MREAALWISGAALAFFATAGAFLLLANLGTGPLREEPDAGPAPGGGRTRRGAGPGRGSTRVLRALPGAEARPRGTERGNEDLSRREPDREVSSENTALSDARYYRETVEKAGRGRGPATYASRSTSRSQKHARNGRPSSEPPREIMEVRATTPEGVSAVKTAIVPPSQGVGRARLAKTRASAYVALHEGSTRGARAPGRGVKGDLRLGSFLPARRAPRQLSHLDGAAQVGARQRVGGCPVSARRTGFQPLSSRNEVGTWLDTPRSLAIASTLADAAVPEIPEHPDQQAAARARVSPGVGQQHGVLARGPSGYAAARGRRSGGAVDHEPRGRRPGARRSPPSPSRRSASRNHSSAEHAPSVQCEITARARYPARVPGEISPTVGRKNGFHGPVPVLTHRRPPPVAAPEARAGLPHLPAELLRPLGAPLGAPPRARETSRDRAARCARVSSVGSGPGSGRPGAVRDPRGPPARAVLHPFLGLEVGLAAPLAGLARALLIEPLSSLPLRGASRMPARSPAAPPSKKLLSRCLSSTFVCLLGPSSLILTALRAGDGDPVPGRGGVQEE